MVFKSVVPSVRLFKSGLSHTCALVVDFGDLITKIYQSRDPAVQVSGSRPNHAKKGPLRKSDHRIVQNAAPRGLPRPGKTRNDYPPSRALTAENVAQMIINRGRSGTESLRNGDLLRL